MNLLFNGCRSIFNAYDAGREAIFRFGCRFLLINRVSFGSKYESDKDASNGFLILISPFLLLFGVATRFACGS